MKHIKNNRKIYFLILLLIINAFIFYSVYYISAGNLTVAFLDVGQGDSIFVEFEDGE